MKTKKIQSSHEKNTYTTSSLVKLHTKKIEDPKMTRTKLKKILELQNTKTKNFQSSQEER